MVYSIFVNIDDTSDIYTTFNDIDRANVKKTENREISLTTLETEVTTNAQAGEVVVVVHGGLTLGATRQQITDLVTYLETAAVFGGDVDIFYLSNYLDNCMNRVGLTTQPTTDISNYYFTYSTAPNGIGCVASTKEKWLAIIAKAKDQNEKYLSARLSSLVISEKIVAATSQPLFVFPDINKHTESIDSLKTQYCRIEKNFGQTIPNTENLSFFWFILGTVMIVFVAWVMSNYAPKNQILLVKRYPSS